MPLPILYGRGLSYRFLFCWHEMYHAASYVVRGEVYPTAFCFVSMRCIIPLPMLYGRGLSNRFLFSKHDMYHAAPYIVWVRLILPLSAL